MRFRPGNIRQLADEIMNILEDKGLLDNCTTCMFWNDKKEICKKFNQRPPAKVIVSGCEYHELIPF